MCRLWPAEWGAQATHTGSVDSSLAIHAPTGEVKLTGVFWLKVPFTHIRTEEIESQDLLLQIPEAKTLSEQEKGGPQSQFTSKQEVNAQRGTLHLASSFLKFWMRPAFWS